MKTQRLVVECFIKKEIQKKAHKLQKKKPARTRDQFLVLLWLDSLALAKYPDWLKESYRRGRQHETNLSFFKWKTSELESSPSLNFPLQFQNKGFISKYEEKVELQSKIWIETNETCTSFTGVLETKIKTLKCKFSKKTLILETDRLQSSRGRQEECMVQSAAGAPEPTEPPQQETAPAGNCPFVRPLGRQLQSSCRKQSSSVSGHMTPDHTHTGDDKYENTHVKLKASFPTIL